MRRMLRHTPATLLAAVFCGALLSLPQSSLAVAESASVAVPAQADHSVFRDAEARLNKSQFKDVRVSLDNGIATLTGSVSLYEYKQDAESRVRRVKGIAAVRNLIEVSGPNISDRALQAKLAEKLMYDRVGYGNAFNAIGVQVENGVVTLGGHARTYMDRDSALDLVNTFPGVKDVVNQIEVDPNSFMDDQTRVAVARAIYGYPTLSKYSIDPARPIRISVQNGHVELYGMVDSQADKDVAFLRANGVPGVFSVKNYLQIANQPSEAPR